jgi:hypothetical protein
VPADLIASADTKSAVFTGHRIGSAQVRATSGTLAAVPSGTITVTPGSATQIRVETAADGTGAVVPPQTLQTGKTITAFAVTRDASLNFVANITATWSLTSVTGGVLQSDLVPSADFKSAVLTARAKGSASIQAASSGLVAVLSGTISVFSMVASQVRVETSPDGSGAIVPIQNLVAGRPITMYCVARDSANVYVANQAADSWVLQNASGGVVDGDLVASVDRKSAVFTAHRTGTAQIKATSGTLATVPSGTITVLPGAGASFTAVAGTPQSAVVGTTYKTALASAVKDSFGNGVRGVGVTYSAPSTGAGGTFAGSTRTVLTDSTGTATSPTFTANSIAGKYADTARAPGFATPALFLLTNTADIPAAMTARTGTLQSTPIITAFPTRMSVTVLDRYGNPVQNAQVMFVPPSAGPSGTFPGGSNSSTTDTAGVATAPVFVANSIAGTFTLTANAAGVSIPVTFILTNLPGRPGSIVPTAGNPQSTTVGTTFGLALAVIVRDAASNPVRDLPVLFAAPASGPTSRFKGSPSDTVRTDSAGFAISSVPVADSMAGSYTVRASVEGLPPAAAFSLTNLSGTLAHFAVGFGDGDPFAVRYAGIPFDMQLVALDRYGNIAGGFGGTAEIASNLVLSTGGGTTPSFSGGILGQYPVAIASSGTAILTVTRSGGSEAGATDSFSVHNPVPQVTVISPPSGTVGYTLDIVLTGTGFLRGVTAVNFGDRIATTTNVESFTRMTVTLQIDAGATTGPRDVLITNKPPGGGTTTLAGTFTVEKNTYPATITLNGQVEFPSKAKPSDYTAADYRLVGIPGGSGWGMKDILSGAHGTDWEAYWDNGQSSDYLVPFDDGPNFLLTAGRAFWLVRRGGVTFQGTVPSTPLDSGAVGIPIHSGWNLITNPMVRNTPWSDIQAANGGFTELLFGFNGAFFSSADLRPYAGYYFFNSTGRQRLRIPYLPSQLRLPRSGVETGTWRLALDLRAGSTVDRTASLGVSGDARAGLDRYDNRKPRAVGAVPSIEFQHPEWDPRYPIFATDIRGPFAEREIWRFRVVSGERQPMSIAWRGSGDIPAQLFLIDESRVRAIDLRADSVYTFTPATDVTPFIVVAGSAQAVSEILAGVMPQEFGLGVNFPNPFNPSTTIPVTVPAASDVRLAVYNILGEEIRTLHDGPLAAGRHWITWDGRGQTGLPVAAGVYICRMVTAGGEVFGRKMVLLK